MKKEMSCLSEMCLDEFVRYISDKKYFVLVVVFKVKEWQGFLITGEYRII